MKRFFFGMVAVMVLLVGFGSTAQATNNFTISNYTVDMELGRDSEQRSTLRTKLTITADFPHDRTMALHQCLSRSIMGIRLTLRWSQ